MREFKVTKKYENLDIYHVLKKEYPNLNSGSLNKVFRLKDVKLNDVRVSKDEIVHTGDVCKVYLPDSILFGISDDLDYVYEDKNIIVAYKPKGIESNHEYGRKNPNVIYFDELVKKGKGENIKILNRLDTNTEGLVLFSKTDEAYNELFKAFKENLIKKEYIAVVNGKLPKEHDTLSNYILKDSKDGFSKVYEKQVPNSKKCITEYTVLKYIKKLEVSILNITLHTGRTHQIRAHMKYISHEIVGDSKYGLNVVNDKFKVYTQMLYAVKYSFNFKNSSPLLYLNNISIDVSENIQDKINKLLTKSKKLKE